MESSRAIDHTPNINFSKGIKMVDYFIFLKIRCDNDNFSITKYKLSRTSSCHFHDKFYSKFEFFLFKMNET